MAKPSIHETVATLQDLQRSKLVELWVKHYGCPLVNMLFIGRIYVTPGARLRIVTGGQEFLQKAYSDGVSRRRNCEIELNLLISRT